MVTEEFTITILKAGEGKELRRKSDGTIYGDTVWLGYNHYDSGLPISASQDTADDFEEIDKPAEGEISPDISYADRLARMVAIVKNERTQVNSYGLSDKDALALKQMFPIFGEDIVDGTEMPVGFRFQYTPAGATESTLYEVIKAHNAQMSWLPGVSTAALYKAVNITSTGAQNDPIAYTPPMEIYNGKYYTQNGVTYLCTRDSGTALSHDLSALVGLYVSVA